MNKKGSSGKSPQTLSEPQKSPRDRFEAYRVLNTVTQHEVAALEMPVGTTCVGRGHTGFLWLAYPPMLLLRD